MFMHLQLYKPLSKLTRTERYRHRDVPDGEKGPKGKKMKYFH